VNLEALIFDVDGALVDTEELHRQAYNQTFLDFGFGREWNASRYAELLRISGGHARIAAYIDQIEVPPAEKVSLRRVIPAIHREKTRFYGQLIASNSVRLRPGVARLIDEARSANVRLGLLASSASANVDTLATSALGRERRKAVVAIVCGDMVTRKKPAPDIYELLLSMLRVLPDAAIAFKDSTNGVLAAKSAGLCTVFTPNRWTLAQTPPAADLALNSLGDPGNPIDPTSAASIGAPYLELSKLEKLRLPQNVGLRSSKTGY
jgi:HAD superfamily hydrolase (TIGR01509 family)